MRYRSKELLGGLFFKWRKDREREILLPTLWNEICNDYGSTQDSQLVVGIVYCCRFYDLCVVVMISSVHCITHNGIIIFHFFYHRQRKGLRYFFNAFPTPQIGDQSRLRLKVSFRYIARYIDEVHTVFYTVVQVGRT